MPATAQRPLAGLVALALILAARVGPAQSEDARQPSAAETIELERLDGAVYHLLDARAEKLPRRGAALLVVLPGGNGGWSDPRAFLPFVENGIHATAAPEDFVTALGVARRWHESQQIVWPLQKGDAKGAEWTAIDYVDAMIADVRRRRDVDRRRVYVLAWSSSGPLAYAALLRRRTPLQGAYLAMSVFESEPRALRHARGTRVVLDQSPEDRVTPFRFARRAYQQLTEHDAEVWLRSYAGGHGWHDAPLPRIAAGLRWLDGDGPAPEPQLEPAAAEPAAGENLLRNGSFEKGTRDWTVLDNSGRLTAATDDEEAADGRHSLLLIKNGGAPPDVVRQDVDLRGAARVQVSAWVAASHADNAFVKFFAYDEDDELVFRDVDILQVRGDRDGAVATKSWDLDGKALRGTMMIVMVMGGELRLDDLRVVTTGD